MFWTNFAIYTLLGIFIVVCPLMCLVILMQRSKQEGLGAAFGGGFTDSVWGAQTSNVLVKATVIFAAIFFVASIGLARLYTVRSHILNKPSSLQQDLLKPVPMTATNAAGTPVVPTETPLIPAAANPPATNAAATTPAAAVSKPETVSAKKAPAKK